MNRRRLRGWPGNPARSASLLGLVLLLHGCNGITPLSPATGVVGDLQILGPGPSFASSVQSDQWRVRGTLPETGLTITRSDGLRALRVTGGDESYAVLRPIDAVLLATPYLGWSWNVSEHAGRFHPARLVVGFASPSGTGTSKTWADPRLRGFPSPNRGFMLVWADSALSRGGLTGTDRVFDLPGYTVRGGPENIDRWKHETVDLAGIYRRIWPNEDMSGVRIVSIGLAVEGGRPLSSAMFSGIRLFK